MLLVFKRTRVGDSASFQVFCAICRYPVPSAGVLYTEQVALFLCRLLCSLKVTMSLCRGPVHSAGSPVLLQVSCALCICPVPLSLCECPVPSACVLCSLPSI
ncbi:hypothetical protein STEG23_031359 [Scotinomys teguina]